MAVFNPTGGGTVNPGAAISPGVQEDSLQRMIKALSGQTPPLMGAHSLEQPSGLNQLQGNVPANMLNTPMDRLRMQRAPVQPPTQMQPLPGQMQR